MAIRITSNNFFFLNESNLSDMKRIHVLVFNFVSIKKKQCFYSLRLQYTPIDMNIYDYNQIYPEKNNFLKRTDCFKFHISESPVTFNNTKNVITI